MTVCSFELAVADWISATARASFYLYNSTDDVDRLIEGLASVQEIFGAA